MSNDSGETIGRKVTDWKALIAAAGLFSSAVYFIGTLFHEHVLADVRQLIVEHSSAAATNRTQFFKDIESDARGAVGRIGEMERNCAVMQSTVKGIESDISGLEHWRSECSQKIAGIRQYIDRDAIDIGKIGDRIDRLEGLIGRGRK